MSLHLDLHIYVPVIVAQRTYVESHLDSICLVVEGWIWWRILYEHASLPWVVRRRRGQVLCNHYSTIVETILNAKQRHTIIILGAGLRPAGLGSDEGSLRDRRGWSLVEGEGCAEGVPGRHVGFIDNALLYVQGGAREERCV